MLELLTTIALLCQTPTGIQSLKPVEKVQLSCQKYYLRCVRNEKGLLLDRVEKCLLKRVIN